MEDLGLVKSTGCRGWRLRNIKPLPPRVTASYPSGLLTSSRPQRPKDELSLKMKTWRAHAECFEASCLQILDTYEGQEFARESLPFHCTDPRQAFAFLLCLQKAVQGLLNASEFRRGCQVASFSINEFSENADTAPACCRNSPHQTNALPCLSRRWWGLGDDDLPAALALRARGPKRIVNPRFGRYFGGLAPSERVCLTRTGASLLLVSTFAL